MTATQNIPSERQSSSGFTLVEVLIAGILALILILPISRIGYQVVRASQFARESAEALAAGQAQLEILAAEDVDDISSGQTTSGEYDLEWTVSNTSGARLVRLTVTWELTGREENLTLNTVYDD